MRAIDKLSKKQISEIAEMIDTSYNCYINSETGEVIFMMNNEMLYDNGISWEDDDEPDNDSPDWEKDLYSEVKSDMAKIDSWDFEHTIRIEKPESHESFNIMENFVDEIIPEGRLKQDFWQALSRSHPFRNFNGIVHDCKYREDWFQFKQKSLEEYVRREIERFD